jgi:hypothetical protein
MAFNCAADVISEMNHGAPLIFVAETTIRVILRSAQRLVMLPVTAILNRHWS